MKIRIEVDKETKEEEIVIICRELNDEIYSIQKMLSETMDKAEKLSFYKKNTEYYLSLSDIIFFDTDENFINAHTKDDIYKVKYKLYELEGMLPNEFIRVSKSTIINVNHVISVDKNITSSSVVGFDGTYKTNFVSRHYFNDFKNRLDGVRR